MGPVRPLISSSQPLQEPASTSRIASARPKRRRTLASTSRPSSTTSASPGPSGSVAMPILRILLNGDMSAPPVLSLELAEHVLRADQLVAEDAPRHREQVADERVAQRVPDRDPLLVCRDHVVGAQHREMLGNAGL